MLGSVLIRHATNVDAYEISINDRAIHLEEEQRKAVACFIEGIFKQTASVRLTIFRWLNC